MAGRRVTLKVYPKTSMMIVLGEAWKAIPEEGPIAELSNHIAEEIVEVLHQLRDVEGAA